MLIDIDDMTDERFTMKTETQLLEVYPWVVLNLDEIGTEVAFQLYDAEYDITQAILDEEINDYLVHIHERILEQAIQKLEDNGVMVY